MVLICILIYCMYHIFYDNFYNEVNHVIDIYNFHIDYIYKIYFNIKNTHNIIVQKSHIDKYYSD